MQLFGQLRFLLRITRSTGIARRYFVTNGFDGALTMLGLLMGFRISGSIPLEVALSACLGAAIALTMSGLSSAYISETAERKKELRELEEAMLDELDDSAHAQAAKLAPIVIALVNGLAPFGTAVIIMSPLWMARAGFPLPLSPFAAAAAVATALLFLYGIYLGSISGTFWLWSGIRTLIIAIVTGGLILLLGG